MSAPDLTAKMMDQFRHAGIEKHSTILLGAGASVTSGLPDWDTFATRLLIGSGSVDEHAAQLLLSRQDPLIVVEAARVAFGNKWDQKLRAALYEGVASLESLDPSPLHRAAVGHYLEQRDATSLVTLNFDTLLERAVEMEIEERSVSITDSAEDEGEHAVHHLHGIITPQETKDVVLTLNDFTRLIEERNSWQVNYLRSAVGRGALIIAGTSYRDPDLRQWLHEALRNKPRHHKAFVLLARQGFDVSKEEFGRLQRALSDQWSAVGLQPVLLQDHTDAAQIIRELGHIHDEDYEPPQERCHAIWEAHNQDFEELQQRYVTQLSIDATEMKDSFDAKSINLTLWLSDGEGHLVRWASQDRIYRDPETLRTVETGHDSLWVAGQALGDDTVLFKDLDDHLTRRWRSVLAVPLPVAHPHLPSVSSAVLTVGLPDPAKKFEATNIIWGDAVARIADEWGERLARSVSPDC